MEGELEQMSRAPTEIHIYQNIAHQASDNKPGEAKFGEHLFWRWEDLESEEVDDGGRKKRGTSPSGRGRC